MTTKLIASGLAAAFSLGTAAGVALTQPPTTPTTQTSAPAELPNYKNASSDQFKPPMRYLDAPERSPQDQVDDGLVCKELIPGERQCWPKSLAPDESLDTTCYESSDNTICYSTPKRNGPELEI